MTDIWADFQKSALQNIDEESRLLMRLAFYSGATGLLATVLENGAECSPEEAVTRLKQLQSELQDFAFFVGPRLAGESVEGMH